MKGLGLALHFANGDAFFAGALILAVSIGVLATCTGRRVRLVARLSLFLGAALIAASGTPLPVWAYLLWAATVVYFLVVSRNEIGTRVVRVAACVSLALTAAACLSELPFHISPVVHVPRGADILVIGDSITAGLNDDVTKWHQTFGHEGGYRIVDLAEPGATLASALNLLRKREPGSRAALAIVEIGGNDMLESAPPERFERELDALLSEAASRADRLLVMELPVPPFCTAYGSIQRRLAWMYSAALVPKRVLARVLGAPDATLDGLHLSQKGHDMMAREMSAIVRE